MSDPAIYQVTVVYLTSSAPHVEKYEVAATGVDDALEYLRGCGWVRWMDANSVEVSRQCRARSKP